MPERFNCQPYLAIVVLTSACIFFVAPAQAGNPAAQALCTKAMKLCEQQEGREEALQYLDQAIKLDSSQSQYHGLKAGILYDMDEDEEALKEAELALALDKRNFTAWDYKARALARNGRAQEAITCMNNSIKIHADANAYNTRGRILRITGRLDEAKADMKSAIKLNYNLDTPRWELLDLELQTKNWQQAISQANWLIEKGGVHQSAAWRHRAQAYVGLKEYAKAEADLRHAIRLWPDDVRIHQELLQVLKERGDAKAIKSEEKRIKEFYTGL
jgi:tetratricopeptide (TPR) repeat protein